MSPTIGWSESVPQPGDSAGLGEAVIRSLKSSVRVGLDAEHVWPAAGGDAGAHRLGSARPYYGAQSLVSSTGSDGRLMQTSDTSRLFGVGSGGTVFYGGPTVISAGSFPGGAAPARSYWAMEFGAGTTVSGSTALTYPNSGFSGKPFFFAMARQGLESPSGPAGFVTAGGNEPGFGQASATGINVYSYSTSGAAYSCAFDWMSIGTRAL